MLPIKFQTLKDRFKNLEQQLQDPAFVANQKKFVEVSQEYSELKPVVDKINDYERILSSLADATEMNNSGDSDLIALAQEELPKLEEKKIALENDIFEMTRPQDPKDKKNVIIEIRAGAGGDESALFAGDLLRMYARFAESKGWKTTIISENKIGIGGYKEVLMEIKGANVYGSLKYEGGVHRVQRVPETEKQGRVHTSTATVVVLPEVEEVEIDIKPSDLRIDTYAASGAGGQHVNKTESAVRVTHLPSGIVATSQDQKNQQQNKARAMQVLFARVQQYEEEKRAQQEGAVRKAQVSSADRSEKIRTYNFPQDRLTDHRIKMNWSNLLGIMDGDLNDIIQALKKAEQDSQDQIAS